jgi:hypothetical protein
VGRQEVLDYFRGIRAVDECSARALEITEEVRAGGRAGAATALATLGFRNPGGATRDLVKSIGDTCTALCSVV